MLEAILFGLAASSALVIGGVAGAYWRPPRRLVAVALAFASGALITAFTFDLFEESFKSGGAWISGLGLLAGAATFVLRTSFSTATSRAAASQGSQSWPLLPSTASPRTWLSASRCCRAPVR